MNQPPNNGFPPGYPYQQPQQQMFTQPQQPQGIFAGMRTAEIFKQGNYFLPGIFNVKILRCLVKQTRNNKIAFIVELETLASNNPQEAVGTTKTWFQDMSSNPATALSAIKEFVIAVYKIQLNETAKIQALEPQIEGIMQQAVSDQNILAGQCIRLETFMKKTKVKGGDFTVHRWTPYDGSEPPAMTAEQMMQAQAPAPQQQFAPPQQQFAPPPQQQFAPPQQQFAPPQQQFAPPQQQFAPPQQQFAPPQQQFAPPQQQFAPPPQGFQQTPGGFPPPPQTQAYPPPQGAAPQTQNPGQPPPMVFNQATGKWEFAT